VEELFPEGSCPDCTLAAGKHFLVSTHRTVLLCLQAAAAPPARHPLNRSTQASRPTGGGRGRGTAARPGMGRAAPFGSPAHLGGSVAVAEAAATAVAADSAALILPAGAHLNRMAAAGCGGGSKQDSCSSDDSSGVDGDGGSGDGAGGAAAQRRRLRNAVTNHWGESWSLSHVRGRKLVGFEHRCWSCRCVLHGQRSACLNLVQASPLHTWRCLNGPPGATSL